MLTSKRALIFSFALSPYLFRRSELGMVSRYMQIPFNKVTVLGNEEKYLLEVVRSGKWSGRGEKTLLLEKAAAQVTKAKHAFFLTSATSALELGCLIADLKEGDEVITPSFAFVSSANAIALRGAKPVFADIDRNAWNITRETVEKLITPKTRAIIPVHYAGSSAGIDGLRDLCKERNLFLIEDAAQSLGAKRAGVPIGGTDAVTCFSLHDTKNITSGEGGLIMTDSDELASQIEIQIEKGTNRQRFFRGQVDKYTWVDLGSSYIASDLLAAVALGQIEKIKEVTERRQTICKRYFLGLKQFSPAITFQSVPPDIETSGHIAAFVIDPKCRGRVLSQLKESGVQALFHYVPLHDAPYAQERGFSPKKDLENTRFISEGLVRLPVYFSMTDAEVDYVIDSTSKVLSRVLE